MTTARESLSQLSTRRAGVAALLFCLLSAHDLAAQGWSGAAMLPYAELEYSGFRQSIGDLVDRFAFRNGHEEGASVPTEAASADD